MLRTIANCMDTYFIILIFAAVGNGQSVNPCVDYVTLNDTTMDISYSTTPVPQASTTYIYVPGTWYRYTSQGQGLLTSTCPSGSQCGTTSQAWVNGTALAGSGPTSVNVTVCIRKGTDCCALAHDIQMEYCNSFVVYKLNPLSSGSRYCFDSSSVLHVSSTTPFTALSTDKQPMSAQGHTNSTAHPPPTPVPSVTTPTRQTTTTTQPAVTSKTHVTNDTSSTTSQPVTTSTPQTTTMSKKHTSATPSITSKHGSPSTSQTPTTTQPPTTATPPSTLQPVTPLTPKATPTPQSPTTATPSTTSRPVTPSRPVTTLKPKTTTKTPTTGTLSSTSNHTSNRTTIATGVSSTKTTTALSSGMIAGIAAGTVAGIAVIIMLAYLVKKRVTVAASLNLTPQSNEGRMEKTQSINLRSLQ